MNQRRAWYQKEHCARIGRSACQMGAPSLARSSEAPNPMQAHNLDASSGEVYETDLLIVDIKPEIYAQTVYSTSQNPHGVALGRKLFSPLEIDVTKNLTKSIMAQLDTASTCNKPPKNIAQLLIPLGHTMKNYLTRKATLFTYDNTNLKPTGKRQATSCFWLKLCKAGTG